jgi:hypothetical protein
MLRLKSLHTKRLPVDKGVLLPARPTTRGSDNVLYPKDFEHRAALVPGVPEQEDRGVPWEHAASASGAIPPAFEPMRLTKRLVWTRLYLHTCKQVTVRFLSDG